MAEKNPGRFQSKLSDCADAVLDKIREGIGIEAACHMAGISPSGMRGWLRRGRGLLEKHDDDLRTMPEKERPYAKFAREYDKADGSVEAKIWSIPYDAALGGDVKAAQWVLARRHPMRYGENTQQLLAAVLDAIQEHADEETCDRILETASGESSLTSTP